MIVERVRSGMAAAKHKGMRCGRPPAVVDRERVRAMHKKGWSLREIGHKVNVSYATVARLLAKAA
jgi:DNA invertase Pin-like site-specific DNA recombinase